MCMSVCVRVYMGMSVCVRVYVCVCVLACVCSPKQAQVTDKTPYTIMFGPDACGTQGKVGNHPFIASQSLTASCHSGWVEPYFLHL